MTERARTKMTHARHEGMIRRLIGALAVILIFYLAVFMSEEIGEYVRNGITLALTRVIPTALPFMLVSDVFIAIVSEGELPLIGALSRLFGLPPVSVAALIPGNACGFPLGGKLTGEMYRDGKLSKDAAERLLAYSSNASPPFVIAAVGGGMLGDSKLGLMLLICVYIATFISAQPFRMRCSISQNTGKNIKQKYSFVASVKSAGVACVSLASFIITFSVVVGIIKKRVTFEPLRSILISLLEVTGASNYFASRLACTPLTSIALIGFSLGFGGLSVFFQTAGFASECGLSMRKYFEIKLIEGMCTALLSLGGYMLFFR